MNYFLDRMASSETLLDGTWTSETGTVVTSSVLPMTWTSALERIGHDLRVRNFNGSITHVAFEADHYRLRDDDEDDFIYLFSNVTPEGGVPHGMAHSGECVLGDADEEAIAVNCASLIQDQVARTGILWPRGRTGDYMGANLVDGVAVWCGGGEQVVIGALPA